MRSPKREAIAAAVEKVAARREAAVKAAKSRGKGVPEEQSGATRDRVILSPLKPGSRTPEEFEAAVRAVIGRRKAPIPPEPEVKPQVAEKPTVLAPMMRSPKKEAIEAAVKTVVANAANAEKPVSKARSSRGKPGLGRRRAPGKNS
jgi:hypothetical protein